MRTPAQARRSQARRPAALEAPTPKTEKLATFPAPVGGWIRNQALAVPGARLADGTRVNGAYVLENWLPTATGARMRRGSDPYAQLDGVLPVTAMFSYVNGNNQKLFATTAAALWDITTPAQATNGLLVDENGNVLVDENGNQLVGVPSITAGASVSGLAGGDWIAQQFATSGGVFLRAVNGADTPLAFDGTAWDTSPAITGPGGFDPKTLSFVWVHQRRLFFVQKDSLNAWYLAADAIGGAAAQIPLGGVFPRGGSLLFGQAWSLETGNGLSEQCAFFSTEGEVAIYQGTDPASTSTWQKVGVYRIGKPRGKRGFVRAGGDIIVATDIGFLPLSTAVQRDFAALAPSALSYPIEEAWKGAVADRSQSGWSCEIWPTKQLVLAAPPTPDGLIGEIFAANARTGAWGHVTGWNATCMQLFGDRLFFGSLNGLIVEAEVTGLDQGAPYTAVCVPLFDALKAPASLKTSLLMRATLRAPSEIVPQMSLQADYAVNLPTAPDAAAVTGASVWGSAIWGTSVWGGAAQLNVYSQWQSVAGSGYAIAPSLQITSGNIVPPDVELVKTEITYDMGDIVT